MQLLRELEKTYKSLKAAKSQAQKTAAERKWIAASSRAPVRAPRPRLTTLVYGVRPTGERSSLLRCRFCEEQTGRPLFWHRDVNAARNKTRASVPRP